MQMHDLVTGIFFLWIWVRYKDPVPMSNSIFFSQKGAKNSQFAADCQSEKL